MEYFSVSRRCGFSLLILLGILTIVTLFLSTDKYCLQSQEVIVNSPSPSNSNLNPNPSSDPPPPPVDAEAERSPQSSPSPSPPFPRSPPPTWPQNSITSRDINFYPQNPNPSTSTSKNLVGPAVLLRVKGGLGNQLFQYACHYAIARSNNWPLYIFWKQAERVVSVNRTWTTTRRDFALDLFNIPLGEWNLVDEGWNVTNPHTLTDTRMLSGDYPRSNAVIQQGGEDYCQSEVFFYPYKSEILDLLWPLNPLNPPVSEWAWKISSAGGGGGSVAVHVRRGDYLRLNASVPLPYFRESMQEMVTLLPGTTPTFFVFSDDIQYLKNYLFEPDDPFLRLYDVHMVSNPGVTTSHEELHLMSMCKHQIISFSSFGWWGAYLNRNPGKIVLAAHAPESLFEFIYKKNEKQKQFFLWEYRHIYYPVSWRARHPQWNYTEITSTTTTTTTA